MAEQVNFDLIWNEAVQRYFSSTTRTLKDQDDFLKIHDTDDLIRQLESSQQGFASWRSRHSKFTNILKLAVLPCTMVAEIAQSVVSCTTFAPASTVLGAVIFLIRAADGVSDAYDWIETLFNKLAGFTQRLEQYADSSMNPHLQQKLISILCCLLELIGRSEIIMKEGRLRRYSASTFLGRDNGLKAAFDKLNNLFEDENQLVQAIEYATVSRIDQRTQVMEKTAIQTYDATKEVAVALQDTVSRQAIAEQKALLERHLYTGAYTKNARLYAEVAETALEDSGAWLLKEQKYKDWVAQQAPLLFVSGSPGQGKTYLSALTVSRLRSSFPQNPPDPNGITIAYFFVKSQDQDLQDLGQLLKTVAYQICQANHDFESHVVKAIAQPENIATAKTTWKTLFLEFYGPLNKNRNSAMIIVDGLDEAPKKAVADLFDCLQSLRSVNGLYPRLSVAVFGRPELMEFVDSKNHNIFSVIEIGQKNEDDIRSYVNKRVKRTLVVSQTQKMRSVQAARVLAREIRDKVMSRADGMFFKVFLIMNEIDGKERRETVLEAIGGFPRGLDEMIQRVFDRLYLDESVDKDDLNEILMWVGYSRRALYAAELYAILEARTGHAYDTLESRLRGKFASLFKVTRYEESRAASFDAQENSEDLDESDIDLSDIDSLEESHGCLEPSIAVGLSESALHRLWSSQVRFTHGSIRDFLVSKRFTDYYTTRFGPIPPDRRPADFQIATSCTQRIINYTPVQAKACNLDEYSRNYFLDHLLSIDENYVNQEEKQPLIKNLVNLFCHAKGIEKFIYSTRFCSNKILYQLFGSGKVSLTIISRWLQYAKAENFTPEEMEWISKSVDSTIELFRPLALQAHKMWLTKHGFDDDLYSTKYERLLLYHVWIVHCFLRLPKDDNYEQYQLDIGGLTAGEVPELDLSEWDSLANFGSLPKDQHWLTCYGWMLFKGKHYTEASDRFRQAIQMNSHSWKALQGLSNCLAEQGKWDEASDVLVIAIAELPERLNSESLSLECNLTKFMLDNRDFNSALHRAKDIYDASPQEYDAAGYYIEALFAEQNFKAIAEVFETLSKLSPQALLLLREVHHPVGCALRSEGKLSLAKDSLWFDDRWVQEMPWVAAWIAEFKYFFYDDVEESLADFETILTQEFKTNMGPELSWQHQGYLTGSAEHFLPKIYLQKAMDAHKSGQDASEWVVKLRFMSVTANPTAEVVTVKYRDNIACRLLGLYYREVEGAEKSKWMPCFRHGIQKALNKLENDEHVHYQSAFDTLGSLLLLAGDIPNGTAAHAVSLLYWECCDDAQNRSALSDLGFTTYWVCAGFCSAKMAANNRVYKTAPYDEFHFCQNCEDVQFCERCFQLLKKGKLPYRICSADHVFLQMYPVPESAKNVAARFVDGERIEIQVPWLDALRKEWDLE